MLNILVISSLPWRTDNSFGNTYSNWFAKMDDVRIAHLYLGNGLPFAEKNVERYFRVSEEAMAKSVFKLHSKKNAIGEEVYPVEPAPPRQSKVNSFYGRALQFGKEHHPPVLFLCKELIWKLGNINYDALYEFVSDVKPDIIFMGMNNICFLDRVARKIYKHFQIPIVMEVAIDVYTLKQISFFPSFWIKRFWSRYEKRRMCKIASLLYTISEKQKIEYSKYFDLPVKAMYKFPDKERMKKPYEVTDRPLRYLFTGNIGLGRWKSLGYLAAALKKNGGGVLDIFTPTILNDYQKKLLCIEGVSTVHEPITQKQVIEEQNNADVLVHVESFNLKNKLEVRYSISTKIMDYISVGRCIFAIGPRDIASIEYLNNNNLALIASNQEEVGEQVKVLRDSHNAVAEIASHNLTFSHHLLDDNAQRKAFLSDLTNVANRL